MKFIENIKIEKLWHGGIGIATNSDGRKILIKWWPLPWSIVDIRVIKSKSDHIEWHISKIHFIEEEYSDWEILCPHYIYSPKDQKNIQDGILDAEARPPQKTGCGGCKRQIINYNKQLLIKKWLVEESFDIINKHVDYEAAESDNISNITINNPIPSPKIRWYRNKIEFSFGKYISAGERLSEWSVGFHKQWEFAKIVDIDECFLIDKKLNDVYKYLKNILATSGYDVYDQKFHRWVFRHLMLRQWQNTDQIMTVLAISDKYLSSPNDVFRIKDILSKNDFLKDHISTMVLVINNGLGDIMFAPDSILENLRWDWYIYESLKLGIKGEEVKRDENSLNFKISPQSFFQTNTSGAEVLFQTWIKILSDKLDNKNGLILDLYCGAGTIWLSMLTWNICKNIIWVDVVSSSISDANINASQNNLSDKAKFYCGKAEDIVKNLKDINNLTAIVIDPPREWLHPDVINFLLEIKKKYNYKLLYISCNPVTMARDIYMLMKSFKISEIQPMDMFPHTHHIENIWLLE